MKPLVFPFLCLGVLLLSLSVRQALGAEESCALRLSGLSAKQGSTDEYLRRTRHLLVSKKIELSAIDRLLDSAVPLDPTTYSEKSPIEIKAHSKAFQAILGKLTLEEWNLVKQDLERLKSEFQGNAQREGRNQEKTAKLLDPRFIGSRQVDPGDAGGYRHKMGYATVEGQSIAYSLMLKPGSHC